MKRFFTVAVVFFCALSGVYAQQKYALIIGNESYPPPDSLRNTRNDANAMKKVLEDNGWNVQIVLDGTLEQMESAAQELKKRQSQ